VPGPVLPGPDLSPAGQAPPGHMHLLGAGAGRGVPGPGLPGPGIVRWIGGEVSEKREV